MSERPPVEGDAEARRPEAVAESGPDKEEEPSFVEGDEATPRPTEGAPLESVLPEPTLPEQVPAATDQDVSVDSRIEEEVGQHPMEEIA
ncbi:hypothetical protein U1Q18_004843 [Sarracenia purpurea var. burkii]